MAEFVDAWPTARKRHRCGMCSRWVEPGEAYWRQAGFDGRAWTNKTCEHCERVVWAYGRQGGDSEWEPVGVLEWLSDAYPAVFAALLAGWRFPDGEPLPLPFGSRCQSCGCRVEFGHRWCGLCDAERITNITRQLQAIRAELKTILP